MKCNVAITTFAVLLLLLQNGSCLESDPVDSDETSDDDTKIPNERITDIEEEGGEFPTDTDDISRKIKPDGDKNSKRGTASRPKKGIHADDISRRKRNVYPETSIAGHGRLTSLQGPSAHDQDGETLHESGSNDAYRYQPRGSSATGISVGNGWAAGLGKAYASGDNSPGYNNDGAPDIALVGGRMGGGGYGGGGYGGGTAGGRPPQFEEEYASKAGKRIVIASAGDTGSSGQGTTYIGGPNPNFDQESAGIGRGGDGGRPGGGTYPSGGGYPGANSAADERNTYNRGYSNDRPPAGPVPGIALNHRVHGIASANGGTGGGVSHSVGVYPGANPAADERNANDGRRYGNERSPYRPVTGVALDHGTDRRVIDNGYSGRGNVMGHRIPQNIGNDERIVYTTDGRPTRFIYTDRNGGVGVVDHFFESKPYTNGLSGGRKVTGHSFSTGTSLAYANGGGNAGAVAYGSGVRGVGAVAYGSGIINTGETPYGSGVRDGGARAYGSGVSQGEAVAYGSGIVSGEGISVGRTYVGPRSNGDPNGGSHSVGVSLKQGTFIGNGYASANAY